MPNDAEKLCYAFLVANIDWDVASLSQWATKVLSAQPVGCKLAQECIIPDDPWWRRARAKGAAAYEPLRAAIKGTRWEDVELDRIGAAMQRCGRASAAAMGWAAASCAAKSAKTPR